MTTPCGGKAAARHYRADKNTGEVTAAIPTYGVERVLLETLRHLLDAVPRPAETVVVEQTSNHAPATAEALPPYAEQRAMSEPSGAIVRG